MEFKLPELNDKNEIISYIQDHYTHNETEISSSLELTETDYENWVKKIHDNAVIPDEIWGKSYTYLAYDNNKLIGLLSIRYGLPNELAQKYGHIGYGVRPSERQKGYATKILKYALKECKNLGLNKVILGCYKENIASAKTIIKNGGKLIRETNEIKNINNYYEINLTSQYYEIEIKKENQE